jgi:hypothetical protein
MDAFETLVLILGIMLAVFLALGIVVTIYIIKVMRHIQAITQKAETAVGYAQSATKSLATAVSPGLVAGALLKAVKKSFRK